MDKAEEKLRQHGIKPGVNITEGFFKLIMKCMDEYAQQVSREVAIDFSEWIDGIDWDKMLNSNYSELFDEWQKQK